ncbi:MAG: serine hydrolase [Eubacteriales bacterium]
MQENKNSIRYKKTKRAAIFLAYLLIFLILALIIFMFLDGFKSSNQAALKAGLDSIDIDATDSTAFQTPESEEPISTPTPTLSPTPFIIAEMPYSQPEEYGFSSAKFNELDEYIQKQIDGGFPGVVLMVAKDGHIVYHKSFGYSKKYDGKQLMSEFESMQDDTLFDLASLSKIYATTFSIMKLVDDGVISLDGKVKDYLSNYGGGKKDDVTVRMLLSHNAGYIKDYYFYKDADYATRNRDEVYNYVKQIPLDNDPGNTFDYNNLDYIILGMIVEEASGMRIDEYARKYIYEPLEIDEDVTYRPLDIGIEKQNIAATERLGNTRDGSVYFEGIRQYTIQGEVHDENAFYSMDQVSGHAGLFANAYGLTVLNQVLLNKGEYGGVRIYKEETINNWMTTYQTKERYQLGFWNANMASVKFKKFAPYETYYHNGWTGTATLVDKENNISIILLTNKRHCPCPNGNFEAAANLIAMYVPVFEKVYDALLD